MNNPIFRKKSLERVSSPEQLNDYVRVSDPGVFLVLTTMIVLLAGVFVFGIFGYLETTLDIAAVCKDGELVCYIPEEAAAEISIGMAIRVGDREYTVSEISAVPVKIDETIDEYVIHLSGLSIGQWVYLITTETDLENGTYKAQITTERISPISLIFN